MPRCARVHGDLLPITASAGAIILRRDPYGVFTVPITCQLMIPAPLFAENIPVAASAVTHATRSVYGPYWAYMAEA